MKKKNLLYAMIVTFFAFYITIITTDHKTSSQKSGVYVRIEHDNIYWIGIVSDHTSGGVRNADYSNMKSNEWVCISMDMEENKVYDISFYDQDDQLISKRTLEPYDSSVRVELVF